ncbi:MAG: hypothetical protein AAF543_22505 [Pseudomonadota bacterium]
MAKSMTRWWALVVAMILGTAAKGGLAQDTAESEEQAFDRARAENTETAYRDFLRRYPEGQFTAEAFRDLVGAVVKSERPIFQPAFDNQLLIEGLMPAPVEATVATNDGQDPY